ncbi:MAG: hypothetical protein K8U03_09980 [Planctomycetia bacterium]|nr:hypothetical protein [Planctomycetia bacterium]
MSIGSLGIIGSIAATPASQAKAGVDKAREAADIQQREVHSQAAAEDAAGIGVTDGSTETSDRDADGRRLYEAPPEAHGDDAGENVEAAPNAIDPSGQSGSRLDLSG